MAFHQDKKLYLLQDALIYQYSYQGEKVGSIIYTYELVVDLYSSSQTNPFRALVIDPDFLKAPPTDLVTVVMKMNGDSQMFALTERRVYSLQPFGEHGGLWEDDGEHQICL